MTMYRTSSLDGKVENRPKDNFDFCNIEADKMFIKFTPPTETRFYSKNKFSSRLLSKSVPRKSRTLFRYKINRSLNFDVCQKRNDYFLSPKATNHSPIKNIHLSRSAKILKALNIEYNPMTTGYKKINKTLNFELTPSPKRFPKTNSRRTISDFRLSSPSPRINKSLNFDSCDDSPIASTHNTSVESIDENQNQTPSQRSRKVKKSLSYISLSSNGSSSSFDFNLLSPTLRPGLREKINDIVRVSMTPVHKPIHRSYENLIDENNIVMSTPRNLYKDFSDDDQDRPETPENVIRLIPESMSAIKKSHRKERFSGRFLHRAQIHGDHPKKIDIEIDEERPSTPLTTEREPSPNYSIHSIKKSHKKDKSRKRISGNVSDDEQSDTGSLFDYSEEIENLESKLTDENNTNKINQEDNKENEFDKDEAVEFNDNSNFYLIQDDNSEELEVHTPPRVRIQSVVTTSNPSTPENRINYLQKIMSDSIKKSHKKLKDSNKKKLFKPQVSDTPINIDHNDILCKELEDVTVGNTSKRNEEMPITPTSDNKNRSVTPENVNSSRILLAQFSSVKKSHKKDKHRKIGFAQRQISLSENNNGSHMELEKSQQKSSIPLINISEATNSSNSLSGSFSLHNDKNSHYESLRDSLLNISDEDFKLISSPNKRKSPLNSESNKNSSFSSNQSLDLICKESAEDEFKIFTPIKRRKSFIFTTPRVLNNCSFSTPLKSSKELSKNRCETPKLGVSILNNEDNFSEEPYVYSSPKENNDNGRLTPDNQNCMKILSALSSIKKSHRKDKWTKARRIRLVENDRDAKNFNNQWRSLKTYESSSDSAKNESSQESLSPKPSTSYLNENNPISPSVKTPPNSLEAKSYLRLVQSTSIKRSHKKMREKKKLDLILDPNLSDDGSIFDEKEKSQRFDNSIDKSKEFNDSHEDFVPLDNSKEAQESISKKYSSFINCSNRDKHSNDGSIFGSDEEIED
ncbi:uncharacterized protein [Chelonus insularis]|uniref:uncharacterized protein n=1 Tax=Chelonus insularis TaxID=460826 RepID=UPI001588F8C8|nr:uncharacterized protein LOC118069310 [Chelonus insularis]